MPNPHERVLLGDSKFTPDGTVEVLDFEQIDVAVVNKLALIFKSLRVSEKNTNANRKKCESLLSFLARDLNDTVSVGEYADPNRFLAAVAQSGKSMLNLPMVYVSRSPDWSYAEIDVYRELNAVDTLVDDSGVPLGELDLSVVRLDFSVNIVGWQKDSIEALSVLLTQWLRQPNADHCMTYKAYLGNSLVEFFIDFAERKDVAVTSNSAGAGDGGDKIKSLMVPIVVNAQIGSVRFGTYQKGNFVGVGDQYREQ